MRKVTLLLALLSVGAILAPIGVAVYVYRDNPLGLILPPQIEDLMHGDSSFLTDNVVSNNTHGNGTGDATGSGDITINFGNTSIGGITPPEIIDGEVDSVARTFTWTVNLTNPLVFDVSVKEFNTSVLCTQHNFPLGTVQTSSPIWIGGGQTARIVLSGAWSQEAESHFASQHLGASEISVSVSGLTVEVNGITIQLNDPISIGNVPIR